MFFEKHLFVTLLFCQCSVNCGQGIRTRLSKCKDKNGTIWTECLNNLTKKAEISQNINCIQENTCS